MIAYYSWSGNTETLANTIQEKTGGDLVRIEPEDSYPDSYDELVERAIHDQRNMENLQIVQNVEHMEDYDIVFIGYPIWFDTAPAVVQVFLDTYDFSGKTVLPFCTHMGSGIDGSMEAIRSHCPGAIVEDGFDETGDDSINEWLQSHDLLNK